MQGHDEKLDWPKGLKVPGPTDRFALMGDLARECRRRHWIVNELMLGLLSLAFFVVWVVVFGRGTQWLERYASFDLLTYLREELGTVAGILVNLMIGPLGAIITTVFASHVLSSWRVRRTIARYKTRCVYCDYDLSDVMRDDEICQCSECGQWVAPLKARFHRWHVVQAVR